MSAPVGRVIHGAPFAFAQAQHAAPSKDWHDLCQEFTHDAFSVPSDGTPTAAAWWAKSTRKHPETDPAMIPRGVPVYWTGGSSGAGHAAVSRGDGTVWGTDLVRDGQVDVYKIADVHARWGLTLVGWTEDIDGVRVWEPGPPPPPPIRPPLPNPGISDNARHPNVEAIRTAGNKALRHNRSGRIHDAIVRVLRAIQGIR